MKSVKCKVKSVKLWSRFAATSIIIHFSFFILHSVSANAETVKTASQPWVTNRIEQAAADLRGEIAAKADAEIVVYAITNMVDSTGTLFYHDASYGTQWTNSELIVRYIANAVWQRFTPDNMRIGSMGDSVTDTDGHIIGCRFHDDGKYYYYSISTNKTTIAYVQEPHTFSDGSAANLGIVRSNVRLVIREVETANGQKQLRLIRCD